MGEEKEEERPTRSFVEEETKKSPPTNPKKMPLFEKMNKIIEGVEKANEQRQVIAYQLTRIADKLTGQKTRYDDDGNIIIITSKETVSLPVGIKEVTPTPKPTPPLAPTTTTTDEGKKIMNLIPSEFLTKLEFIERENDVRVNVKEYLPSEDFAKVAGIFRDVGGNYISAGKESHFIVPFLKETKEPESTLSMTSTEAAKQLPAIQMVKDAFTEDLRNMLVFEDTTEYVTIKPRQYLGSENFAKIASIVRELSGEYISAGKESHFRVKKK